LGSTLNIKVRTVTGISLIEGGTYEEGIGNFAVSSKDKTSTGFEEPSDDNELQPVPQGRKRKQESEEGGQIFWHLGHDGRLGGVICGCSLRVSRA